MSKDKPTACETCGDRGCPDRKWNMFTCTRQERQTLPIDDPNACYRIPPIHFVKEPGEPAVQISGKPDPEGLKKFDEKASAGLQEETPIDDLAACYQRPPITGNYEWKTPLTWTDTLADTPDVRTFASGATRDTDEGKPEYGGFLSPLVIEAYGAYMTKHQVQADGELRASDNWQLGQPKSVYFESAWRHLLDLWKEHRGLDSRDGIEEALGGLFFNICGYWLEYLRERDTAC